MRVGICGYPGSGKSTVFVALAPGGKADRDVAFGNIKVPDARVDALAAIFHPKKTTYAEITFVDVGGGRGAAGGAFPPEGGQAMRHAHGLVRGGGGLDDPSLPAAGGPGP